MSGITPNMKEITSLNMIKSNDESYDDYKKKAIFSQDNHVFTKKYCGKKSKKNSLQS